VTKKDKAAFKFWRDRGYVEEDGPMMRLTEAGRMHYGKTEPVTAQQKRPGNVFAKTRRRDRAEYAKRLSVPRHGRGVCGA